jgi:hypothetical protein
MFAQLCRYGPRRIILFSLSPFALLVMLAIILCPSVPAAYAASPLSAPANSPSRAPSAITLDNFVFLPLVTALEPAQLNACVGIPTETYSTLSVDPPVTDRPADKHADLNLGWRGYVSTTATLSLVNINGPFDSAAPQFPGLFADSRTPGFSSAYQVYNWSWGCNCATSPIAHPSVTLLGMLTTPGELIRTPASGYDIGSGYTALVLYAALGRITIKYTRDDNVIQGYTIHVENVCVEPALLALYDAANLAGRGQLPALRGGQPFARAAAGEMLAGIQDSGTWMDPRSRKDWWQ